VFWRSWGQGHNHLARLQLFGHLTALVVWFDDLRLQPSTPKYDKETTNEGGPV
jgi:hypothetical protein